VGEAGGGGGEASFSRECVHTKYGSIQHSNGFLPIFAQEYSSREALLVTAPYLVLKIKENGSYNSAPPIRRS